MRTRTPSTVQVACDHDLLVIGLQGVLAPRWDVRRVRTSDDVEDGVLLVDVDDPGHAGLLEMPHVGRTVAWSWRSVSASPPGLTLAGWLRKGADAASIVAAFEQIEPPMRCPDEDRLSNREVEVLQGLVDGFSNSELAERMYLSTNTIKTHVRSVYRKTDSHHRAAAVAWGMLRGMRPGQPA